MEFDSRYLGVGILVIGVVLGGAYLFQTMENTGDNQQSINPEDLDQFEQRALMLSNNVFTSYEWMPNQEELSEVTLVQEDDYWTTFNNGAGNLEYTIHNHLDDNPYTRFSIHGTGFRPNESRNSSDIEGVIRGYTDYALRIDGNELECGSQEALNTTAVVCETEKDIQNETLQVYSYIYDFESPQLAVKGCYSETGMSQSNCLMEVSG